MTTAKRLRNVIQDLFRAKIDDNVQNQNDVRRILTVNSIKSTACKRKWHIQVVDFYFSDKLESFL